jgi:hypothetical protein
MALKRGYFPDGYESKIYATSADPANDPQLEVKEYDCKLTVIQQGDQLVPVLYIYRDGTWQIFNTWTNILNKPPLAPSPHDWYGEHHTGDRPLKAKEHTRDNPVHLAIRLEAILMAESGSALTGSSLWR